MTTYQELKSAEYLDGILEFAERLLGVKFSKWAGNKYSAHCPFHADTKDSFRVYVNDKGEVRFHCFGACGTEWDIYDLIRLHKRCSFTEAQGILAAELGVKNFQPYQSGYHQEPEPVVPDEPVSFLPPPPMDADVIAALSGAAVFYNRLLQNNAKRFPKAVKYLNRRGITADIIDRFQIGYAPALADEHYSGRALIDHNLDRFKADWHTFNPYTKAGLFRLLNDETYDEHIAAYYRRHIDFSRKDPFSSGYSDFFAARITFPIHDIEGQICGFMGRKTDNRKTRWIKQRSEDTVISTKGWLYGIDKAARWIEHYRTIILVEGIFDYFAFYRLLQDEGRPIMVSTLGTNLDDPSEATLKSLSVQNIIVAYDWDSAGRSGIHTIAQKLESQVFYLGGLKEGEDPADKLKQIKNTISGFSMKRLTSAAKEIQKQTDKPVMVSMLSCQPASANEVIFKPDDTIPPEELPASRTLSGGPGKYFFKRDRFLPELAYNHANKASLDAKIQDLIKMLNEKPSEPPEVPSFHIYASFINEERYDELGPALILWLRLAIEQQHRKRHVKQTDQTIADWLQTTRPTVNRYKRVLNKLGYLSIDTGARVQKLSVSFSPQ